MKLTPRIVKKPWGREIWLVVTDKYALKILEINAGKRFSLQYHRFKTETWYLQSGKIKATYGKYTGKNFRKALKEYIMKPGDVIHVPTRTVHRLFAVKKSQIIEVSTPQLKDVVRLEDDFGRVKK
ncbi:cupin domain-containing protein [Candidatus Woesearchaeota archaeon]|nr:cupin domain-containing protein [Candidatus Woesearchaeota archaeon]